MGEIGFSLIAKAEEEALEKSDIRSWNSISFQRVYGITTATVKVGYEYVGCDHIMWNWQTTKLSGHEISESDVGGWYLNVQHKYNFHAGILQKGDGSTVYLKYKPQVWVTWTCGRPHLLTRSFSRSSRL